MRKECLADFGRITVGEATVFHGSNLDVLPFMADNSVDAIVTDPPYELGFMGKSWDSSGIAYSVELWRECLRVLKPGGHILSFGGTRTYHRMAVAIEDAGFELRDSIAWLYGSGFPKSHDISKAIDKATKVIVCSRCETQVSFDNVSDGYFATCPEHDEDLYEIETKSISAADKRTVIGTGTAGAGFAKGRGFGVNTVQVGEATTEWDITAPATDDAKKWAGWGTALKPGFEPVVVGRKPLIGTVAANVLEWGVGGLNIDASRIGYMNEQDKKSAEWGSKGSADGWGLRAGAEVLPPNSTGRWPANIILDEYTAEMLDLQSGISKPKPERRGPRGGREMIEGGWDKSLEGIWPADAGGGASRFFYVAKANKRDRNEGLDEKANIHPTVKPTELMRYLIKLVTPAGGVVLDPFTGSGSTGKAALLDGYKFIGIELTEEYLPIIEGRLKFAAEKQKESNNDEGKLFDA